MMLKSFITIVLKCKASLKTKFILKCKAGLKTKF